MGCGDVWMLGDAARERILERDGGSRDERPCRRAGAAWSGRSGDGCARLPVGAADDVPDRRTAALYVEPQDHADLLAVHRAVVETRHAGGDLGEGVDVLVPDDGFAGLVLRLGRGSGGRRATVTS